MATYTAASATVQFPPATASVAGDVKAVRGEITVDTALALNDVVNVCKLPAQHVPVDFIADSDDHDSGGSPAIVLKVGIGSDDDALISSTNIAQAGGVARMDAVAGLRMAPSDTDRYVFFTVSTGPATGATGGKLGGTLLYRAANDLDR